MCRVKKEIAFWSLDSGMDCRNPETKNGKAPTSL